MKRAAFEFTSIRFAEHGRRPHRRILATVKGRKFEFVRLDQTSEVEAYDFPKSWDGLPRFIGYLPSDQGERLMLLAHSKLKKDGRHVWEPRMTWPWMETVLSETLVFEGVQ